MSDPGQAARVSILREGDLVVNSTGTGTLGRVGLITQQHVSHARLVADGHVTIVRLDGAVADPRFVWYHLSTDSFYELANATLAVGSTNQTELGRSALAGVRLRLPPLDEQQRIVEALDAETSRIDELILEQGEHQRALQLERYRSLLVNTLIPSELPSGWSPTRLKFLFEFERNGIWGDEPQGDDNDVVCVRVADFDRVNFVAGLTAETLRNVPPAQAGPRLLRAGDVLLEKSGGTADKPVGCAVTFNGSERAVCSNFVAVLRPRREVDPRYAGLLMAAHYQARLNAPFVKQTTGIQNLDSSEYLGLRVCMPATEEQGAVVRKLETARDLMQRRLDELDHQVALLREHRQALVTAAVTGGLEAVRKVA
jgi:type I restriction enzyme S subunit